MSLAWSAAAYGRHAAPRLRPGLDLLARVGLEDTATVVDLGCGSGALLPALRARFPKARITGVDLSPAMLAKAAEVDAPVELIEADAATWRPPAPVDLILANAVLHWVPDHARLMPELLACCRVLAVQVPANFAAPSHRLVRELLAERGLAQVEFGDHTLPPERYHDILVAAGASVELWETIYHHELDGPDPVLDWLRGTALLPVHAALGGANSPASRDFERALGERLRAAYPTDAAGRTLFPFRRLFFVATVSARPARA